MANNALSSQAQRQHNSRLHSTSQDAARVSEPGFWCRRRRAKSRPTASCARGRSRPSYGRTELADYIDDPDIRKQGWPRMATLGISPDAVARAVAFAIE